jgi:hypothetical protein
MRDFLWEFFICILFHRWVTCLCHTRSYEASFKNWICLKRWRFVFFWSAKIPQQFFENGPRPLVPGWTLPVCKSCVTSEDKIPLFQTRYQALVMLSQIPPSDVVTSEHWSSLKKSLSLALGDENDGISVSMPLMILNNLTEDVYVRLE